MGGRNDEYSDAVYEFDVQTEEFRLLVGARLQTARELAVAVMVDADAFPPC